MHFRDRKLEYIHGLPVLTYQEAALLHLVSITSTINRASEDHLMPGMAAGRNPNRACWVEYRPNTYQLHCHRADIRSLEPA